MFFVRNFKDAVSIIPYQITAKNQNNLKLREDTHAF